MEVRLSNMTAAKGTLPCFKPIQLAVLMLVCL